MIWTGFPATALYEVAAAHSGPGLSVIAHAGVNLEPASSLQLTGGAPVEIASARASASWLGFAATATQDRIERMAAEMLAAPMNDAYLGCEESATIGLSSYAAAESLSSAGLLSPASIEMIGGISVSIDGLILSENLASLDPRVIVADEICAALFLNNPATLEQESRLVGATGCSVEWLFGPLRREDLRIEWSASGGATFLIVREGIVVEISAWPPAALVPFAKNLSSPGRIRLLASPGRARFRGSD
jgi:hypothetical protein